MRSMVEGAARAVGDEPELRCSGCSGRRRRYPSTAVPAVPLPASGEDGRSG
jgi:hypothetical protein